MALGQPTLKRPCWAFLEGLPRRFSQGGPPKASPRPSWVSRRPPKASPRHSQASPRLPKASPRPPKVSTKALPLRDGLSKVSTKALPPRVWLPAAMFCGAGSSFRFRSDVMFRVDASSRSSRHAVSFKTIYSNVPRRCFLLVVLS